MSEQSKKALVMGFFLAVVLAGGGTYLKLMMVQTTIDGYDEKAKKFTGEIVELKKEEKHLNELAGRRKEIDAIRQRVEELSRRLPPEERIPEIITLMKQMLLMANVSISFFEQDPKKIDRREIYNEVPCQVKCRSSFHKLGQFINMIEVNPDRIMRIKEFVVKINEKRPYLHDVDMMVAAYVTTNN